jgi:hypothetical protein
VRDGRSVHGGRPRPGWRNRVLCAPRRGNVRLARIGLRLKLQVSRGRPERPVEGNRLVQRSRQNLDLDLDVYCR